MLDDSKVNAVNSRDVREYVGSKQQYADWIKKRLKQLGAIEGEDYLLNKTIKAPEYGLREGYITQNDYIVTLDIAKHLAMMEHNDKGREVRIWFLKNTIL